MAEQNGQLLPGTYQVFVQSEGGDLRDQEIVLTPPPTNSPNDPINWSPWRKYWHSSLVLFVTALTAATSNDAGSAADGELKYYIFGDWTLLTLRSSICRHVKRPWYLL